MSRSRSVMLFLLSVTVCYVCRSRSVIPVGHGLLCLSVTVCYACRSRSVMPVGHGLLCFFCCRSRSVILFCCRSQSVMRVDHVCYAFLLTVVVCNACRSRSVMLFLLSVTVCHACRSRSVMPISRGLRFVMDTVCGRRRRRCKVLPENRSDLQPIGPNLGSSEFR